MVTVFAVCAIVGVLVLVGSLILGDIDLGGIDLGGGVDSPGLPWLSAPALAAGVGVFGVVGWPLSVGTGVSAPVVVAIAVASAIASYALLLAILSFVRRSQTGTVAGLRAAIGRTATVSMTIPAGGWGQISYLDADSSRATTTAIAHGEEQVENGTQVLIVDVEGDRLVVEPLRWQA